MNGSFKVVLKAFKIRVLKNPLCIFFPFPELLRIAAYSPEKLENSLICEDLFSAIQSDCIKMSFNIIHMVERKTSPGLSPELNKLQPVMELFIYLRVKKRQTNFFIA